MTATFTISLIFNFRINIIQNNPNFSCPNNADLTMNAKDACDGYSSCQFHGDNTGAGDPCGGAHKYTELVWKCVDDTADTMCAYLSTVDVENNWKTTSLG
jgi:hypothetical protein